ncbi:hypothetical protein KR054_007858 [Drosophila jambulina]|nr:hypothetical protein KR054_007858 [Drosophila jambulina]
MKQDIIPEHDDCITPLTIAAIEEEELRIWTSEDDDDDDESQSVQDIYFGDDVTLSDEETPAGLEPINLTRVEVEDHEALLDRLIQDYIRAWEELAAFSDRLVENVEALKREMFSNRLVENIVVENVKAEQDQAEQAQNPDA